MKHIFISILISIIFTGCSALWVKEEPQGKNKFDSIPAKPEKKDLNEQTKCFYAFKDAWSKKNWKAAYGLLSVNWHKHQSLKKFTESMEKCGRDYFKDARILTIVQMQSKTQNVWAITSINHNRKKTLFVLKKEKNNWKIDGVKNLDKNTVYTKKRKK